MYILHNRYNTYETLIKDKYSRERSLMGLLRRSNGSVEAIGIPLQCSAGHLGESRLKRPPDLIDGPGAKLPPLAPINRARRGWRRARATRKGAQGTPI